MTRIKLATTIAVALLVVSLAFVASAAATQTRTVPSECINPDDEFTVTINCPGTGGLVETLCDGWTYTGSSLPADQVDIAGNDVTFKLVGDTSFTYTVEAPDTPDTCCTISGFFRDMDSVDHPLDDDTVCTCQNGAVTATRTVPSECINPDDEFTVTINCPGTGGLVETLCDGWTYTGSSLPADQVDIAGNDVTFKLVGDTSFTYTVEAPDTPDTCCTISGFFRDMDSVDHPLDDDTVCTCTPCPCDFCMPLEAGLNLVSVPRHVEVGGSSMASAVFDLSGIETCDSWDGCAGKWSTLPPTQMQVVPDRAYFVYKANAETLCLNETQYLGAQTLCADTWAMVGFPSRDPMTVAEFRTASSLGDDFTTVWLWNNGGWYPTEDMVPYRGYVLWMTVGGTMPGMITK